MFDTYKAFKELKKEGKFTEQQAASIVKIISNSSEQNFADLATKQDIELLEGRISTKMSEMHASILKWVFGMFVAFGGAIITAMFYAIKYMPVIQQAINTH